MFKATYCAHVIIQLVCIVNEENYYNFYVSFLLAKQREEKRREEHKSFFIYSICKKKI